MLPQKKLRKFVFQLSLLLLILNVLGFSYSYFGIKIGEVTADSRKWLYGDWQYRRSHVINPASGAESNYQVRITAYYSSAITKHYLTNWNKYVGNPLFTPTANRAWPAVVYHNGIYYMYLGYWTSGSNIRLYTSTDGVNFAEHPNSPVIIRGAAGSWEEVAIEPHSIIYINGQWRLYYCGRDASDVWRIGYAYSSDLISWTKYSGNPIMSPVSPETGVADPHVFLWQGKVWMQYSARGFGGGSGWSLMVAWSNDGISFTRSSLNPIRVDAVPGGVYILNDNEICGLVRVYENGLWEVEAFHSVDGEHYTYYNGGENVIKVGGSGQWDAMEIGHLDLIKVGDTFKCYYAGRDSSNTFRIGLATTSTVTEVGGNEDDVVYLNGHCRSDFGDVRFTDDDGVTLLDYWMETKVDGEYAVFWVKVADDLSTNPATIYIYYGNPSATTTSNGENTFLFFDDFLGTTYDSNKWQAVGSPTITVSNGELKIQRDSYSGSWSVHGLRSKTFQADEKRLIVKMKFSVTSGNVAAEACEAYYSVGQTNKACFDASVDNIYLSADRRDVGGSYIDLLSLNDYPANTYYTFYLTRMGSSYLKGWLNGKYKGQVTSNVNDGSTYIGLFIEEWGSHGTIIGTYDYIAVTKYVDPEPSHGAWGSEETGKYIVIDEAFVSDERADVGSIQTVSFHAKWSNNNSDVIQGSIYVNGTEYVTNSTGWISFTATSSQIGKQEWTVTAVNCSGVTAYTQTVPNPAIIWDQIQITNGGTTKDSLILGETATIWFQAKYQYDNTIFDNAHGILYVNDLPMLWSTTNNRWEYQYTPTTPETKTFTISAVQDNSYGLTVINDLAGAQTINVWSTPFSIISNSTITELAFNSTTKTITFTVTGPTGTTGYTNITIAKTLIENITDLVIYLDENQIEYTATSTEHAWLIQFIYTHSTHKVTILLNASNTTSPSTHPIITALPLSGILIAIAISLIAGKKSQQKNATKLEDKFI